MNNENKVMNKQIDKKIIDATGKTLGRLASEVARILMGKNKATFKRNAFSGTPVMIKNAGKIKITGKKLDEIYYTRFSGYPGGLRVLSGTYLKKQKGMKELVKLSIYQMLPGNKIRKTMMKNLEISE